MNDLETVEGIDDLIGRQLTAAEWDSDEDEIILYFGTKQLRICVEDDEDGLPVIGLYTEREGLN